MEKSVKCFLLCMLLLLVVSTNFLIAQDAGSLDEADIDLLFADEELIVVTVASNVVSDAKKQPVSVTTITRLQLEMSGARTLSEAIMMFVPGFFLVEDQDDTIAGFRGLTPDNNLKVMLLLNGQYMNTEWFWGATDALLHTISYDWIDQVQVIRGPGSVTLGQGALLGVINIITKKPAENMNKSNFSFFAGDFEYKAGSMDTYFATDLIKGYFYLSSAQFLGQRMRNEGWIADKNHEGFRGGQIYDNGHRLKHTDNTTAFGNFEYKGLEMTLLYTDQQRDLYNFYRDRDRVRETLTSLNAAYRRDLSEKVQLKTRAFITQDDFGLSSVVGLDTGGTRENRFGLTAIFNLKEVVAKNQTAIGFEYKRYEFGRSNLRGDNFIVNNLNDATLTGLPNANIDRTWVYADELNVYSAVFEDFFSVNDAIDVFAAFRYDNHPFWGDNISPRLGALYSMKDRATFRLSWQTGFRGAAGVHYGGGYRNDGLLQADNFSQVDEAHIPILGANDIATGNYEQDIPETVPEKMSSFELAVDYKINDKLSFTGVGFYNQIDNVIDVGVIWRPGLYYESQAAFDAGQPTEYSVPGIGTDVPGDWNGYWFYKNNDGKISESGFEFSLSYVTPKVKAILSHSMVSVADAPDQQRASMYLTQDLNFKAFPENVTRLNIIALPIDKLTASVNCLYYLNWYSPRDQEVDGNMIVNIGLGYQITPQFTITGLLKNLLDQDNLYPMNSNAGGEDLSDGTPSLEKRIFWMKATYSF